MQTSSDTLVEALKRLASSPSDEGAWKILLGQLWPRLLATSFRILRGSRALAEDATQEALLRLVRYSRFADFQDSPDAFVSYALAVCRNISLTYLSRVLREPESSRDLLHERIEPQSALENNPELIAVRLDLLARFTLTLDVRNRQLLKLLLEGYTITDIAERLEISYSATAVRIHRLRNELAKLLKEWKI